MAAVPSLGRATGVTPSAAARADATRSLYERFHRQIFGYCMNQLGSREEAEDATQSTFLNAHRALERGTRPDAESAWLFKIAHNVCLSRRRSSFRRRKVEAPSDLQSVQDFLAAPQRDGSDDLIRLTDALAHMPDNQRRAILLREWQGLSYREIADELELSQAAVETLIFRARRALAQNLEHGEDPTAVERNVARGRKAIDYGTLGALLHSIFAGSGAVKAAATAVAVTGLAVAATAPPKTNQAAPLERAPAAGVALRAAQHDSPAGRSDSSPWGGSSVGAERVSAPDVRGEGPKRKAARPRANPGTRTGDAPATTAPVVQPEADPPAPLTDPAPADTADAAPPAAAKPNAPHGGNGHGSGNAGAKADRKSAKVKHESNGNPGQGNGQAQSGSPGPQGGAANETAQEKSHNGNGNGNGQAESTAPAAEAAPGNSGNAPGHAGGAPGQSGKDKK